MSKTTFTTKKAIRIAVYASHGLTPAQIIRKLGTSEPTWTRWMKKQELCKQAYAYGQAFLQAQRKGANDLRSFILGRLSPKQRKTYESIEFWSHSKKGHSKIDDILKNKSVKFKQSMWLHAYLCNGFNASKASMMIGVDKNTLTGWKKDADFADLIDEIKTRRNDFYESRLIDLVAMGDSGATIFVNRTVNKDRGYGEKIEIEHSGEIDMTFSLDQLALPVEVLKQVYEAFRKLREPKDVTPRQLPAPTEPIDLEGVVNIPSRPGEDEDKPKAGRITTSSDNEDDEDEEDDDAP